MTQSKQIGLAAYTCAHISSSNENIRQMGSIVKVLQENKKLDEDKLLQKRTHVPPQTSFRRAVGILERKSVSSLIVSTYLRYGLRRPTKQSNY
jgi:hypothetical protein